MKKAIAAFILAVIMTVTCFSLTAYMYTVDENYELNCKNAIVVNTDTGRTVFEKNADETVSIASLTKIMTAMVVIDNCTDLEAMVETKFSTLLTIGNTGLVTINLVSGEQMKVKDLLYCLLISSAADASVVLADYIGGSVPAFVEMMNQKAQELQMANTHFVNTHGLDAEGHYSTARDMEKLTEYALNNELFCDIVSRSSYTADATNKSAARTVSTTNYLISENSGFYYKWADGVKTGYTGDAGRCLISTAGRDETRYVCVVLGCDAYSSNGAMACMHFSDSIYLFEKAYDNYSLKKACKKGSDIAAVPVKCLGIDTDAQGVFSEDFTYLLKRGEKPEFDVKLDSELIKKPVDEGQKLGTCDIIIDGQVLKTVDIVAKEAVTRNYTKIIIAALIWILAILLVIALIAVLIAVFRRRRRGRGGRMKRNVRYQ